MEAPRSRQASLSRRRSPARSRPGSVQPGAEAPAERPASGRRRPASGRAQQPPPSGAGSPRKRRASVRADGRPPAAPAPRAGAASPPRRAAVGGTPSAAATETGAAAGASARKSCPREIVVSETDLRLYGGDLRRLRECDVSASKEAAIQQRQTAIEAAAEASRSFKEMFAERCQSQAEIRDPWSGLENPEELREKTEQDLVINQVWLKPRVAAKEPEPDPARDSCRLSPTKRRDSSRASATTRASSTEPNSVSPTACAIDVTARRGSLPPVPRPASSASGGLQSEAALGAARAGRPRGLTHAARRRLKLSPFGDASAPLDSRRAASRSSSTASAAPPGPGSPRARVSSAPPAAEGERGEGVGRAALLGGQKPPLPGDLDDSPREPVEHQVGSVAVRMEIPKQRPFIRVLKERQLWGTSQRIAWILLDARTGEVRLYPQVAAWRLEAANANGRASAPLGGTGPELEGAIVKLSGRDKSAHSEHIGPDGSLVGEVRRLVLQGGCGLETRVRVARREPPQPAEPAEAHGAGGRASARSAEALWRFEADDADDAEERALAFEVGDLVDPDTLPEPSRRSVEKDRRLFFLNMPEFGG